MVPVSADRAVCAVPVWRNVLLAAVHLVQSLENSYLVICSAILLA